MKCKNCEISDAIKYSKYTSGEFCSKKCSSSFSTKEKRNEINKIVSSRLTKNKIEKVCEYCKNIFLIKNTKRNQICCSKKCSAKKRWSDEEYSNKIINIIKDRCKNIDEKKRLAEIGKKGGFGFKGYTSTNRYYQSSIEKDCYEFLDSSNINFTEHKYLPKSSKISDIYLEDYNIWIEIDGIDREKKKKHIGKYYDLWIEKIEVYKSQSLNFFIVKNINELKDLINKIIWDRGVVG